MTTPKRKPRRLTNLQIAEVSSVDNAANQHAKVRLIKRSDEEMNTLTPFESARRVVADFNAGKISNIEVCKFQQHMAGTRHGNEKSPLAAFLASPIGKMMLEEMRQPDPAQMHQTLAKRHANFPGGASGGYPGAVADDDPADLAVSPGTNAPTAASDDGSDLDSAVALLKEYIASGKSFDDAWKEMRAARQQKASQRGEQY
jgi:hypothetical protein